MADRRIIVNMKTKFKLKKECVRKYVLEFSRKSSIFLQTNTMNRKSFKTTQKLELRDMFFSRQRI